MRRRRSPTAASSRGRPGQEKDPGHAIAVTSRRPTSGSAHADRLRPRMCSEQGQWRLFVVVVVVVVVLLPIKF